MTLARLFIDISWWYMCEMAEREAEGRQRELLAFSTAVTVEVLFTLWIYWDKQEINGQADAPHSGRLNCFSKLD